MTEKYFSFMIVTAGGQKSFNFRLSYVAAKVIGAVTFLGVVMIGVAVFLTMDTSVKHVDYKKLKATSTLQDNQLKIFDTNIDELSKQIQTVIEKEEELKLLLGETQKRQRRFKKYRKTKTDAAAYKNEYKNLKKEEGQIIEKLDEKIHFLQAVIVDVKKSVNHLLDKGHQYKTRFASTPSIRPLYGRIHSTFGWRYHPIRRIRKFHKGIDISAWIGAPIQATADGIVEYAGWSGTFGFVVVIDHGYGYRTIYAHCSQLLTKKRELVKKGQVIAQVGSTGISTGPHLHYEVRKWRQAVSPIKYLDLDMFTASTRIW